MPGQLLWLQPDQVFFLFLFRATFFFFLGMLESDYRSMTLCPVMVFTDCRLKEKKFFEKFFRRSGGAKRTLAHARARTGRRNKNIRLIFLYILHLHLHLHLHARVRLVTVWFPFGSALVTVWLAFGFCLVRFWLSFGFGLVSFWF